MAFTFWAFFTQRCRDSRSREYAFCERPGKCDIAMENGQYTCTKNENEK